MTKFAKLLMATAAFAAGVAVSSEGAYAQSSCEDRRPGTLSTSTGRVLQETFEKLQAEDYQGVLADTNGLIQRGVSGYDRSVVLQLRGSAYASLERYNEALRDFLDVVALNVIPCAQENSLRLNIGQLYLITENYSEAISYLRAWINGVEEPSADGLFLLANAYVGVERYQEAISPAERAIAASVEPKKTQHQLLNFIYSETNNVSKRRALLEKMVGIWSDDKAIWTQLSQIYFDTGRERDGFAVLELAYQAGLLDQEREFVALAQYYSVYDNPYRGARLLEREINAGNVEGDEDNFRLLSQLWSQAREHDRAIPPLRRAARADSTGKTSLRLAQIFVADEQYPEARDAAREALRKGGMNDDDTADTRFMLGFALFNLDDLEGAREQFAIAARSESKRREAQAYVEYIDVLVETQERQEALDEAQRLEAERRQREREEDLRRTQELAGGGSDGGDDSEADDADQDEDSE